MDPEVGTVGPGLGDRPVDVDAVGDVERVATGGGADLPHEEMINTATDATTAARLIGSA
jgi:hypothetical protein